jgi:fatty-acyl-CoA synthase
MKKLSYVSGVSSEPLLGMTIGQAFNKVVAQYPEEEALVSRHQGIRWTYRQLQEQVDQCAKAFLALGLKKGERVGIWSPNRAEWLVTQLGSARMGAVLVNINPSYRLHELEYALNQSGCAMVVTADRFKSSEYIQMLYTLAPELKSGEEVPEKLPHLRKVISLTQESHPGLLTWADFMKLGDQVSNESLQEVADSLDFDDPINIQYTSGTTGYPKGASLSHHNILNNGYLVGQIQHFSQKDRLVIPVPLYHCFGMVLGNLGCITHGATMIYPGDGFDPEGVLQTVQAEKATALYGVPTMFYAELNHPNFGAYDLSSLRTGVMAGALCPAELMKKVNKLMHMQEVTIAYGMTETSPVSTQTRPDDPFEKRVTTVGKVLPHTEIKIIDPETKQVVPSGTPGELCTRGYCVMLGYWDNKKQTDETIDAARWLHSGDIATMDEQGYINIVGRIKDMIIRGGENIYPKEIEEFLSHHPQVAEVQVIGVPDEKYGEEVCAWLKLYEGEHSSAEEIKAYCQGKIAHFKIPRYIKFVENFPMTVTGKIRKVEMREAMERELVG